MNEENKETLKNITSEELEQLKQLLKEEDYDAILRVAEDIGQKKVNRLISLSYRYLAARDRDDGREMERLKPVFMAEAQAVLTVRQLGQACINCLEE